MKWSEVAQSCPTLCNPTDCSLCPWNSLGKNTGVGCPSLLQGIILTQRLNPGLLHCRQILYHLSHQKWGNNFNNIVYIAQWVQFSTVTQLCPTLCDPMDCSPPGSSVHGIFQAWILEWVAFPFSRESSWPRDRTQVSRIVGRHFTVWATREANKSSEHFCHPGMTYSIAPWSMSGVAYYARVSVCKNECVCVWVF